MLYVFQSNKSMFCGASGNAFGKCVIIYEKLVRWDFNSTCACAANIYVQCFEIQAMFRICVFNFFLVIFCCVCNIRIKLGKNKYSQIVFQFNDKNVQPLLSIWIYILLQIFINRTHSKAETSKGGLNGVKCLRYN